MKKIALAAVFLNWFLSVAMAEGWTARHYPNPVAPGATIFVAVQLPEAGVVQLDLCDVNGRLIARALDENRPSGESFLKIQARDRDGAPLPRGLYFGIARWRGTVQVLKIIVK